MIHVKRRFKASSLADALSQVVTPILKSHDVKGAGLFYDWKKIVGEPLASMSRPEKITYSKSALGGGTLFLTISSSLALHVHHNQTQIIDQINTYFGYRAVAHLKSKHGHFQGISKVRPALPSLSLEEKEAVSLDVKTIEDETLLTTLQALGEAIILDTKKQKK